MGNYEPSNSSSRWNYTVFGYDDNSIHNPVVTVISILPIYMVNTDPAAVAYTGIFVYNRPLNSCPPADTDIWNALSFVLFFLLVCFIVVGTHTIDTPPTRP